MLKSKKLILTFILLAAALVLSGVAAADDLLGSNIEKIRKDIQTNKEIAGDRSLVQVGSEVITAKQFQNIKAYKQVENRAFTDEELWKELITDELFLQLAKEENVYATLAEGKLEADNMRGILRSQPQYIQEIQQKFIAASGMTEEQYWGEIAPVEYQKILSMKNLTNKLIKEKKLDANGQNPNDLGNQIRTFRENLYQSKMNKKVKILDSSVILH